MSYRIQIVGLEGSGKTTLAKVMATGDPQAEEAHSYILNRNGLRIELSEDANTADAVLFCLDGSNLDQLPACQQLINRLKDQPLLIVQTKGDIQTIDEEELRQYLGLDSSQPMVAAQALHREGVEAVIAQVVRMVEQFEGGGRDAKRDQIFEAEPKVVQSREKYKQPVSNVITKPQQTFLNLMKEKKIKQLTPMQQEQEYIRLEKERIKMENMADQLNSFKKKPKKEDIYDIRATGNPRIQVNLEFFLTDTLNTLETQVTTLATQTDAFVKRPPSPPYIPKKTGIDASTQVEDYELFNFDREVTPILDVICTKTLEQACLEIEQEEEFKAMYDFKEAFKKRREKDKSKQQEVVRQEMSQIEQKDKVVQHYAYRHRRIEKVVHKAEVMKIAQQYLWKIDQNAVEKVFEAGLYPNHFQNQLATSFVDWLVAQTQQEVEKLVDIRVNMKSAFDNQFDQIPKARVPKDLEVAKKKERTQRRMTNHLSKERAIRISFEESPAVLTTIAMTLGRFIDGSYEEWRKNYDTAMNELEQKVESNEINEEELCNRKRQEYPDVPEGFFQISVNNFSRFAFSLAHDQYYLTRDCRFNPCAVLCYKDGSYEIIDHTNPRKDKVIKLSRRFRLRNVKQSDDEAIIFRLQEVNPDINVILLGFMLGNLQNNTKSLDWAQNARFGLYDSEYRIPFAQSSIPKVFKLEELVKSVDDPEQAEAPQTAYFNCFVLTRRFKQFGGWNVESQFVATKGMLNQEIDPFFERLHQFVSEQYDFTLERDREIVMQIQEKEKDKDNEQLLSKQEIQTIITRSRLPVPRKLRTQPDSNDSPPASERANLNEPLDVPKSQFYNLAVSPLLIDLGVEFADCENSILTHLSKMEPRLINSCTHGFELRARGQPFLRSKQLIRIREIGQMTLHRKPEPPPVKEEEPQQQPADDQQVDDS